MPRRRVHADDHPVEQVAADEEVHVHEHVAQVLGGQRLVEPSEVDQVEPGHELHRGDDRVGEESGERVVDELHDPLAWSRRVAAARRRERPQCQCQRPA